MRPAPTLLLILIGVSSVAPADEPLRPPERHSECSPSGRHCVVSDPVDGTFPDDPDTAAEPEAAPWHIPEWFRVFWVVDDGNHLVTGYDGLNLVPRHDPAATTILRFWRQGELLRSYTLEELGYRRRHLQETVSHYHWGGYEGFTSAGLFELRMIDGRTLAFDPTTGEVVGRSRRD